MRPGVLNAEIVSDCEGAIAGKPVSYGSVVQADIDGVNAIRWCTPTLMALTRFGDARRH
ncbi:hypothetical protein ACQR3R_03670 [Gordonia sp. IEGM753]